MSTGHVNYSCYDEGNVSLRPDQLPMLEPDHEAPTLSQCAPIDPVQDPRDDRRTHCSASVSTSHQTPKAPLNPKTL
ncbi:unnamed protein product [Lota lota]